MNHICIFIQIKYFRIPLHRIDRNEKKTNIKYNAICEIIWLYCLSSGKLKSHLSLYEGLCLGMQHIAILR